MLAPSLKEIFAVAGKLPAAPQVLAELSELLEDTNAEIEDISDLIRKDGPLAAGVLRISNSVYYGPGGIGSIEAAVNRVGFGEVHRLVGCAATGVLADRALGFYGIDAEPLREHMVCTAVACETLAAAGGFNSRHAYTAGLLRPIGMMVLDRMARAAAASVDAFQIDRDAHYADWETRTMGIRNAAVTSVVMAEWRFAADVVDSVRGHAFAPGGSKPPTAGAAIINLAGWVVDKIGLGLPGEDGLWEPSPEKLTLARVAEEELHGCVGQVETQFESLRPALR